MNSHAQVPRVARTREGELEILFATRSPADSGGNFRSRIASICVSKRSPTLVTGVRDSPVLDCGPENSFDEFGVMPGSVIRIDDKERLYYTGWSRPSDRPYETWIGIAERRMDEWNFVRIRNSPVIGRSESDPILSNGPFVLNVNNEWILFYASATEWILHEGRMECIYKISIASSDDGLEWKSFARHPIEDSLDHECQNAPTVAYIDGTFHMWYCYRYGTDFRNHARGYRMGYATSNDLINWQKSVCDFSENSFPWESEMQCYPGIFTDENRTLMFYCGNLFGLSGFGVAEFCT